MSRVQPEPQTNRGHPRFCPDTVLPLGLAAAGKRAAAGAEGHGRTLTVAHPRPRPHQARPLSGPPTSGSHLPSPFSLAPPSRSPAPAAQPPWCHPALSNASWSNPLAFLLLLVLVRATLSRTSQRPAPPPPDSGSSQRPEVWPHLTGGKDFQEVFELILKQDYIIVSGSPHSLNLSSSST